LEKVTVNEIEDRYVDKATKLVIEKFPEMVGTEPTVSEKRSRSKGLGQKTTPSLSSGCPGHYVLTFEKDIALPGGHSLKRLVRVTMDGSGEVVRITSSK
jgi:hypothetical protein